MTMVATTPATLGVVVMTADEARACLDRIKSSLDQMRSLLLDFQEREGWRALGYSSWRECAKAELDASMATVYRQLRAGKIDREISQVEKNAAPLPTVQADELARLPDAESRQAAYRQAVAESNGKVTAAAVGKSVDELIGERPKVGHRPGKLPRPVSPTRHTDPDIPPDPGDDAVMGYSNEPADLDSDHAVDDDINQEWYKSGPPTTLCGICGERFTGTLCPCSGHGDTTAVSEPAREDPDEAMDPFGGLTPHPDGVSAPIPADTLLSDRTGAVETADANAATDSGQESLASLTPAAPATFTPAPKTSSVDLGRRSAISAPRAFSARPLDAGDLARALLDLPTGQVVEAIAENATPGQRQALQSALGWGQPALPAPASLVDAVRGRTPLEVADAVLGGVLPDAISSVIGLVIDRMTPEQRAPLLHRLGVHARNDTATDVSLKTVKTQIGRLTLAEIRSLEFELPQIRKEVGARERAAEQAAS